MAAADILSGQPIQQIHCPVTYLEARFMSWITRFTPGSVWFNNANVVGMFFHALKAPFAEYSLLFWWCSGARWSPWTQRHSTRLRFLFFYLFMELKVPYPRDTHDALMPPCRFHPWYRASCHLLRFCTWEHVSWSSFCKYSLVGEF